MSDPRRLTPDALDALLSGLDHESFVAFVADLYRTEGRTVEREGSILTVDRPGSESERVLVRSDDRSRVGRLLGTPVEAPPVESIASIDAVATRGRSADGARTIAERADARVVDTAALHDRLLYAIDRETCRQLCRAHFDVDVEPVATAGSDADEAPRGAPIRPPALAVVFLVAILGAFVLVSAGVPGGTPGVPDAERAGSVGSPGEAAPVTPVGGGASTPARTPTDDPATARGPPGPTDKVNLSFENGSLRAAPGSTVTISATFQSDESLDLTSAAALLQVSSLDTRVSPPRSTVDATSGAGEIRRYSWNVTLPESADGEYPMAVVVRYIGTNVLGRASATGSIVVEPPTSEKCADCDFLALDHEAIRADGGAGDPAAVTPGSTITVEGTLTNTKSVDLARVDVGLEVPGENWTVDPPTETTVRDLGVGESRRIAWTMTVPPTAYGTYELTAEAVYPTPVDEVLVQRTYALQVGAPAPVCESPPSSRCHLLAFDTGRLTLPAGETTTITGGLYNPRDVAYTDVAVALRAPDADWTITPLEGTTADTLGPGSVQRVAWNVTVPGSASGESPLVSYTTHERPDAGRENVSFSYPALVTNETSGP